MAETTHLKVKSSYESDYAELIPSVVEKLNVASEKKPFSLNSEDREIAKSKGKVDVINTEEDEPELQESSTATEEVIAYSLLRQKTAIKQRKQDEVAKEFGQAQRLTINSNVKASRSKKGSRLFAYVALLVLFVLANFTLLSLEYVSDYDGRENLSVYKFDPQNAFDAIETLFK